MIWQEISCHTEKPSCTTESHKYTDQTLQMSFDKGAIPCLLCAPPHNIDSCWVIIWQEISCHTEKPSCTTEGHKYTDQTPQISFDKGAIPCLLCASPHNIDSWWVIIWQKISSYTESLLVLCRVTNILIRHCKCLLIKVPYPACYVPPSTTLIVVELLFGRRSPAIPKNLPLPRRVTNIPIWHAQYLSKMVPLVAPPGPHAAIYSSWVITFTGDLLPYQKAFLYHEESQMYQSDTTNVFW